MITIINTSKFLEEIDLAITEVIKEEEKSKYHRQFFGKRGAAASRSYLFSEIFYHLLGGYSSGLKFMSNGFNWWVEDKRGDIYEIPPINMGNEISRSTAIQDMKIRFKKPCWRAQRVINHLLGKIG